jgi:putative Holliday junction resolvase
LNRDSATFLGFDYGERRIGVAVGETLTGSARALPTLHRSASIDWTALRRLVSEWGPAALVVGLPLNEDGSDQPITDSARGFARQLGQHTGLPVHLVDERYSSRSADDRLRQARASGERVRRLRKGDRDGESARVILEQWLGGAGG